MTQPGVHARVTRPKTRTAWRPSPARRTRSCRRLARDRPPGSGGPAAWRVRAASCPGDAPRARCATPGARNLARAVTTTPASQARPRPRHGAGHTFATCAALTACPPGRRGIKQLKSALAGSSAACQRSHIVLTVLGEHANDPAIERTTPRLATPDHLDPRGQSEPASTVSHVRFSFGDEVGSHLSASARDRTLSR